MAAIFTNEENTRDSENCGLHHRFNPASTSHQLPPVSVGFFVDNYVYNPSSQRQHWV